MREPVALFAAIEASAPPIAAAASKVGAFALPVSSKDSSLLLNLPPGNYPATVAGKSGGMSLTSLKVLGGW